MNDAERGMLADSLRQSFEATLEERIDRLLHLDHQQVISGHHFAAASSEAIRAYQEGHFISVVMTSQAVNEGIIRFVADRNGVSKHELVPLPLLRRAIAWLTMRSPKIVSRTKSLTELLTELIEAGHLTQSSGEAANRIISSFRNDVHHMNPTVTKISFRELAKRNMEDLCAIEREIFAVGFSEGRIVPHQPIYWDIQEDGTATVYLRAEV